LSVERLATISGAGSQDMDGATTRWHRDDRFLVSRGTAGEIPLTPMASIPRRELLVWENGALRESLLRGLGDAAAGRVAARDDFLDPNEGERAAPMP